MPPVQAESLSIAAQLAALLARPVNARDRERAGWHLLDWFGCAAAGTAGEAAGCLRAWAANAAPPECALLTGGAASLNAALMVNGALGNTLEMDDVHRTAVLHPGPVVMPAALALAQRSGATPTALLDAIVRGYEAMIRVGSAVGPAHARYWHNTATCGPFGAAAAAASLLSLDAQQTVHALGNAGTQAAGFWQMRHEDTDTKQLHTGHAALAGVTAAELAQHGFRGPQKIFEGPQGFFAAMCGGVSAQPVVNAPDAPWKIAEVSFKPWPACRHVHAAIDCALALRAQINAQASAHTSAQSISQFSAADIATVTVQTYAAAVTFCDQPQPRTSLEAKFSFQQAMAVVLLHGTPTLAMFEPAAINDPAIAALRAKVRVEEVARYTGAYPSHFGSSVSITTRAGEHHQQHYADALGDTERPVTITQLEQKARTLMAYGGWGETRPGNLLAAIHGLTHAPDCAALWSAMRA